MIDFTMSNDDEKHASTIVERFLLLSGESRMRKMIYMMDILAAHLNGCPLKLGELAKASDYDLAHDMGGIIRHIDRHTGRLTGCFLPRYAKPEGANS